MVSHWIASGSLGALGALVIMAPAQAATLQYWWFDTRANQLVFTTSGSVQPTAQMLLNPTRIVVDLPNTQLGSSPRQQAVGGVVREVRAGQFNAQITRLVIELAPGQISGDPAAEAQERLAPLPAALSAPKVCGQRPKTWPCFFGCRAAAPTP